MHFLMLARLSSLLFPVWAELLASDLDHEREDDISNQWWSDSWKFEPKCIPSQESKRQFCVYTSTEFANGRGISIITHDHIAARIEELSSFTKPGVFNSTNNFSNAPWEVKSVPGRGKGLFATRKITRGEVILSNFPVAVLHMEAFPLDYALNYEYLHLAYNQLPSTTKALFMDLAAHNSGDPIMERINTNAFAGEFGGSPHFMMYPEAARMNHDCRPNAVFDHDPQTLIQTTYASSSISPGEEIMVGYINIVSPYAVRQSNLQAFYGFTCTCSLCSGSPSAISQSDANIAEIDDLQMQLSDWSAGTKATPQKAERLLSLYVSEKLDLAIGTGYMFAALAWNAVGREKMTRKFAEKALKAVEEVPGSGVDLEELKGLLKNPRAHWSWGVRRGVREL